MTFAYKPSHRFLSQHQLSVNNKRTGITHDDMLSVANQMNIKKPKEIIAEVQRSVAKWPEFAATAGIRENQVLQIANILATI
jgi:serine/threonine-protein kinase HipA